MAKSSDVVVTPMTDNFADAEMIVKEAERLQRKIFVAQQLSYHPPVLN